MRVNCKIDFTLSRCFEEIFTDWRLGSVFSGLVAKWVTTPSSMNSLVEYWQAALVMFRVKRSNTMSNLRYV